MEISKRLKTAADMVSAGGVVADVGTDHGYLSIYLMESHRAEKVIAMDVAKGPLSTAVANIKKAGLDNSIETRLSDGVSKLKENEADTVVITGMGGNLVMKILSDGRKVLDTVKELILSPQSEIEAVREYLEKEGYLITEEKMLEDEAKLYVIMKVVHGDMKYLKRCERKYGKYLLENRDELLYRHLVSQKELLTLLDEKLSNTTSQGAEKRRLEIAADLECIKEGMKYYEV